MSNPGKIILVVDDESINRMLLKKCLGNEAEYEILEAANGREAVEIIDNRQQEISMVLLDLVMPEMDGFEVLRHLNEFGYILAMPVIAITADNSLENEKQAFELGVCDFIAKPFRPEIVKKRVENMIDLFERTNCLMALVEEQTAEVYAESEQLQRNIEIQQRDSDILLDGMTSVVEFRFSESSHHTKCVKAITEILLRCFINEHPQVQIMEDDIRAIVKAAALHDIGKVAIPDEVLMKEGSLTPEEFEIMKKHCAYGVEILSKFEGISDKKFLKYANEICLHHHEKIDGNGYPDGLKEKQIPLYVQMVSLADVYDSLVNERVYKGPFNHEDAVKMIMNGDSGAFSAEIKRLLMLSREQIKELY